MLYPSAPQSQKSFRTNTEPKVKVISLGNKAARHEDVWGSGSTAPHIL
jgi:hypothetical protein